MQKTDSYTEKTDSKQKRMTAALDKDKAYAQNFAGGAWTETDDPNAPAFTVRAVILGAIWAIILAICNVAFGTFRTNFFNVPTNVATVVLYPMGVFVAFVFRSTPFTIKEHVVASALAGAAGGTPYGINNVVSQYFETLINDKNINIYNSLAWIFCTQFIGFGLAGLCRRFLVKPAAMMWPGALPTVALFNSLHSQVTSGDLSSKYKLSRFQMFSIAALGMFIYHWVPNYFATGLSAVSLICLITSNRTINVLASGRSGEGIGLFALTFDWTVANQFFKSQIIPLWASMNYIFAYMFWGYFVSGYFFLANPLQVPPLQATYTYNDNENATLRSPFPIINGQRLFNNKGKIIKVARGHLLNNDNNDLNETFYEQNRPIYLTASFGTNYFSSFLNIGAVIAHVYLWYGSEVWEKLKDMFANRASEEDDVHNALMSQYEDFPDWYYGVFLATMLGVAYAVTQLTPYNLPWWGPLFGLFLGFVYVVPVGMLTGIAGYTPGLNIITQLIIGLMVPGKTVQSMVFKSYGYNIMLQAIELCEWLKIGHYTHVSPISITVAQLIGTGIGVICNTGTAFFIMDNMKLMLLENAQWSYNGPRTFTTAGGIWGAMGPIRFFGMDSPYWWTLSIGIPLGFCLPFIPWLLNRLFPSDSWYLINFPLLTAFSGGQGRDAVAIVMPLMIALFFNYYLFRFKKEWWAKYNFILSVGLDFGVSASTLVAFILSAFKVLPEIDGWQTSKQGTFYCRNDTFDSSRLAREALTPK